MGNLIDKGKVADKISDFFLDNYPNPSKELETFYKEVLKIVVNEEDQPWVSFEDRLPDEIINPLTQDFEPVICATTFGDVRVYGYGKPKGHDKAHFWLGAGIMDKYVTHWTYLPKPPKENNNAY